MGSERRERGTGYVTSRKRKGSKVYFYALALRVWGPKVPLGKPIAELRSSDTGLNKAAASQTFRILSFVPCRVDDVVITGTLPRDE